MEDTTTPQLQRPTSEIGVASAEIAAIVATAERAADELRRKTIAEAEDEAAQIRAEAVAYARDIKRNAKADAREILREAQEAARAVLQDGTELTGHLQELGGSMRRNAQRLLDDVKLVHARLTADLDQALPAGGPEPTAPDGPRIDPSDPSADPDFQVPEFVPGRR